MAWVPMIISYVRRKQVGGKTHAEPERGNRVLRLVDFAETTNRAIS